MCRVHHYETPEEKLGRSWSLGFKPVLRPTLPLGLSYMNLKISLLFKPTSIRGLCYLLSKASSFPQEDKSSLPILYNAPPDYSVVTCLFPLQYIPQSTIILFAYFLSLNCTAQEDSDLVFLHSAL